MGELIKSNKRKILLGLVGLFVLVTIFAAGFVTKAKWTEVIVPAEIKVGQCAVQYNTCAFLELKNEAWERTCEPVFRSFQTQSVGEKKILFKDISNNTEAVFPKHMMRDKSKPTDDAITNSLYLYVSDCSKLQKAVADAPKREEKLEAKKEEKAMVVDLTALADKCIYLKNNCENPERWQEDQKYCHPFKNVYKVLEVGEVNLRVVTWHGHGQVSNGHPIPVGTETNLSKEEYVKLGYKEGICGDLVTKYNKNFNPLKGK